MSWLSPIADVAVASAVIGSLFAGIPAPSAMAATSLTLLPASGQFVGVAVTRVLDTRYGTGGVPRQPMAASGTVSFPVTGVAGVPPDATSVVLDVSSLNATAKGFLTIYNADSGDPGVASVGLRSNHSTNQTATVPVNSDGTVSITNHSTGTTDVVANLVGYYTGSGESQSGDSYFGVPWQELGGTTTIAAGASQTFQITGDTGIPAGADTAVLQVNAINATASGYLTAYPAGGTDPGVAVLAYDSDTFYRNLLYVPLSTSGQITLANHGTAPVGVTIWPRGYYMPPATTPAGGEYDPVQMQMVYGTAAAGAALAANASVTFQVTGTGNIPASGVAGVTEDVVASNPTAMGHLDEGPAGGTAREIVSFLTGDSGFVGYDNGIVSTLSPSGQETVTNNSSGTVDVQAGVTGVFASASAPAPPSNVSATVSAQTATVTWTLSGADGGSPITGYTVTASPDNAKLTVGGGAGQATLTGLAHASADSFTVTASNAAGQSDSSSLAPPGVISGTVVSPNGQPVSGAPVTIYASDVPAGDPPGWNDPAVGTTTTDANGIWTFTVPSYSALPAGAQAAADNNGGWLNMLAYAVANATAGTANYVETASSGTAAWVGSSAQPSGPVTVAAADTSSPVMTVAPDQADLSSQDTPANGDSTWTYQNSPELTDSNGTLIGSQDPAAAPPTDSYGYQNLDGPANDGYSPFVATDGTDLSAMPAVG